MKRAPVPGALVPGAPDRLLARARDGLAARFSSVEWVMLSCLVVLPAALAWRFASPSFYFLDDLYHFDLSRSLGVWSYAVGSTFSHFAPAYRLTYLVLDRLAPMNFDVALAILVAAHAVSAVLFQRILTLVFGRAWWTYALAFAWAISIVYVADFAWIAASLAQIPAITLTLASIHGYLCWRVTGRRGWLAWSLIAMAVGLCFYEKALLVPVYLLLMRILLLDPEARLRDSLRSIRSEWPVWLAYATVGSVFLIGYWLGPYEQARAAPVGEMLEFMRIFWFEGLWPMVFAVRVPPFVQSGGDQVVIVAAQVVLVGLVAWSLARRRAAWRAWTFLALTLGVNALILSSRVSTFGPEVAGHEVRYFTEAILLVPLAAAFAFAAPRLRVRVAPVESSAPAEATARWYGLREPEAEEKSFRLPTPRVGAAALVALTAYVAITLATTDSFSQPWAPGLLDTRIPSGRLARGYFDNLRADLEAAHRAGQFSLVDHDVPGWIQTPLGNLSGTRYTLLSHVAPLIDDQVTFNQPGRQYVVQPDGHLRRTRFVPAAGGSPAELQRTGWLRINLARVERRHGERCVVAEGLGSYLEWEPNPHLTGKDWWLRASYRTDPVEPFVLESNSGVGWFEETAKLPAMGDPGTAIVPLGELPTGVPTNAGVRLLVPPFGRLCLRSLEIGSYDPPAPSPYAPPPD